MDIDSSTKNASDDHNPSELEWTSLLTRMIREQLTLFRQEIQAEVTAQLRAVDARISSVEEATSQTQRDVSRLESRADEDSVKRDADFQELKDGMRAMMQAMAALSAKVKDT